jgi:hypothetical protein
MRRLISILLCAITLALPAAYSAHSAQTWNDEKLTVDELYERYGGASDQISMPDAIRFLLKLVNEERKQRGLSQLRLDEAASHAAEDHTAEMARFHYIAHLDLAGEKPNQRYNRHGGTNQVSENVSYRESTARLYLTRKIVQDIHDRWMESPPHRRNIVAPEHNAVGLAITLSWDGKSSVLSAAEEFVDDYGDFSALPGKADSQDMLELTGTFHDRQTKLVYIMIGREPLPEKHSPKELNANLNGYSLPKPFVSLMPRNEAYLHSAEGTPTFYPITYQSSRGMFELRFSIAGLFAQLRENGNALTLKPGLYYVMAWVQRPEGKPFIASTQIIRVDN